MKEKLQLIPQIQSNIKNYNEQLYSKKFKNLGEMDKFLETYNLPKLNQEETENPNKPITTSDIEAIIKKTLGTQNPWPDDFIDEFYQTFKEELTPILLKLFQKLQEKRRLPNSFYKASIFLLPKPGKTQKRKKTTGQYL